MLFPAASADLAAASDDASSPMLMYQSPSGDHRAMQGQFGSPRITIPRDGILRTAAHTSNRPRSGLVRQHTALSELGWCYGVGACGQATGLGSGFPNPPSRYGFDRIAWLPGPISSKAMEASEHTNGISEGSILPSQTSGHRNMLSTAGVFCTSSCAPACEYVAVGMGISMKLGQDLTSTSRCNS